MISSNRTLWFVGLSILVLGGFLVSFFVYKKSNIPSGKVISYDSKVADFKDNTWKAHIQAWLYDGPPACNADEEYSDGRRIHVLKPEYFTVLENGRLKMIVETDESRCNGFSDANAQDIIDHSDEQYITVSANRIGMINLLNDTLLKRTTISTLVDFAADINFTGIELDWEDWHDWTKDDYEGYKSFVTDLGKSLHSRGLKLAIIGPPIYDKHSQSLYPWAYEDFSNAPIDFIISLSYDYQYDTSAGNPISPNAFVSAVAQWMLEKVSEKEKIVMGIPTYGYHGEIGTYGITIDTKNQSENFPGFNTAKRDPKSFEMSWTNNGISYWFQDTEGINLKRELIESTGITSISVWHIGGNPWFSGKEEL